MPTAPSLREEIGKRDPFQSPQEEAYLNLQRSASRLAAPLERLLKTRDLSASAYNVLRILRGARHGGIPALPCLEVAQRMITPVPDITRLIDRLVASGRVERRRTADDRRVVLVAITRSGLEVLAKLDQRLLDLHRALLGHLSRRELASLNRLLVKARQASDPDASARS